MKYTREQIVLIFTMLKAQHGDKTFEDLFGVNTDGGYSGKVEDLSIRDYILDYRLVTLYSDAKPIAVFLSNEFGNDLIVNIDKLMSVSESRDKIKIDINRIVDLLNFEDKI